ncbi:MAG: hypothetical protein ACLURV_11515 [Gallintestinimicrobium sp.]
MLLKVWITSITSSASRFPRKLDRPFTGAEVDFDAGKEDKLRIYTTRPDTLFGVTYMNFRSTLILKSLHPRSKPGRVKAYQSRLQENRLRAFRAGKRKDR